MGNQYFENINFPAEIFRTIIWVWSQNQKKKGKSTEFTNKNNTRYNIFPEKHYFLDTTTQSMKNTCKSTQFTKN